jgi:hypothetical protein
MTRKIPGWILIIVLGSMWIVYGAQSGAFDHWIVETSAGFARLAAFVIALFASSAVMDVGERHGDKIGGHVLIHTMVGLAIFWLLKQMNRDDPMTASDWWWIDTAFPVFGLTGYLLGERIALWRRRREERGREGILPGSEIRQPRAQSARQHRRSRSLP